jgi:GNAT superfamily N-acetyltransferase
MAATNVTETALPCHRLPVRARGTPLPDSVAEIEVLASACRRYSDAQAYADATTPLGKEPRVTPTVLNAAGKAYRALLAYPTDLKPGDTVVTAEPSQWRLKRWRSRLAAHERALAVYQALAATPLLRYRLYSEMPAFPALHRRVGASIGALRFAQLEHGESLPWLAGGGMGGQGIEYWLADGMAYADMGEAEGAVYVRQIAVAPQRAGLGRRMMLALKRYCDERNRRLVVYKVATPGFFAALGWLRPDGFSAFVYEPWRAQDTAPVAGSLEKEQNVGAFEFARA